MFLLRGLVAPRVTAAVFSTIWNRWTTRRRFQQRSSADNVCLLGCSTGAEDSVEHYSVCPRTRELASRQLRLRLPEQVNLYTFMLCNPHVRSSEDLTAAALLVYTIYRATNHIRHNPLPSGTTLFEALAQWTREGAKGHECSSRILDSRWAASPPCTPLPPIPLVLPPRVETSRKRARTGPAPISGQPAGLAEQRLPRWVPGGELRTVPLPGLRR